MFFGAVGEVVGDVVEYARAGEGVGFVDVGEDPGAVFADDFLHAGTGGGLRGRVGGGEELLVEAVDLWVEVAAAVGAGGEVFGDEELEEVLGVGVVAGPADAEELGLAG